MILRINVPELLAFFDSDRSAAPHSSAIKSLLGEEMMLALLVKHFNDEAKPVRLLQSRCGSGKKRGHRLDAWLEVGTQPGTTLYQVEVKTWSFHSLNSRNRYVPPSGNMDDLRDLRKRTWGDYWNRETSTFRAKPLRKVLSKMTIPQEASATKATPLACLWEMMHPDGSDTPFFEVRTSGADFDRVCVFSASSYVRGCGIQPMELCLPNLGLRLDYLRRLIHDLGSSAHDPMSTLSQIRRSSQGNLDSR